MAAEMIVWCWRVRSDQRPGTRGFVVWALLAVSLVTVAETLDVTIFSRPKTVLLNTDILLKCEITDFGTPMLDLKNVGIQWLFGPQQQVIYVNNAGIPSSIRPGTKMSITQLKKGDASLHLSNVQLDDAGEYTCVVFVTPLKAEKSSNLLVVAQPQVHLSVEHITIQYGNEKFVNCEASGFYPQQHDVYWEKTSKGTTEKVNKDVFPGAVVHNIDRTFNVSRGIRIEPTMDDDGNVYRCIVTHQSLPDDLSKDLKLTVTEPVKSSATGVIAAVVLVTILLCLFTFCGFIYYYLSLRKVSPEITGCGDRKILKHLEEEVVTWKVSPFRPREIIIWLYLKRKEKNVKCPLFNWSSKNCTENVNGSKVGGDHDNVRLLVHSDWADTSFKPLDPEFETNSEGISSVKISVKIYPDVSIDDGAELSIEVQHQALKESITKTLTLEVEGVPPKVLNILVPPHINHNESVALTCTITGFKPSPLSIIWQQKRKDSDLEEIVRMEKDHRTIISNGKRENSNHKHYISEVEHDDKTWSKTSVLVIVPDINQDQDLQYFCKIQHPCTNSNQEKEIMLKIAAKPQLKTIKSNTEKAIANVPMILSCEIFGFYPREISVTWLKNGQEMVEYTADETIFEQDGLYHLTSNMKVVPTRTNSTIKYTCQVAHVSLAKPIETDFETGEITSLPTLTAIEIIPPCPKIGMPVTLSCKASGFYPERNQIFWFKGFNKIENDSKAGIQTGKSELDRASGLYSRSSQWTFKPTANDHGKEFKIQILHSETSSKPVTASYILKLKDLCSDKNFQPSRENHHGIPPSGETHKCAGKPGEDLCSDKNFQPSSRENHHGIPPSGETHKCAGKPCEDAIQVVSQITCQTENPKAGQPVTLSCDVNGHFEEDVTIIWYRAAYPFDERKFITNTRLKNGKGFTTALTYTPKKEDKNDIQVFIDIDMMQHSRSFSLKLS